MNVDVNVNVTVIRSKDFLRTARSAAMSLPKERPKRTWTRLREKSPQPPVDSDEELPFPDWGPLPDFRPMFPEEPRPEELQIGLSSKPDEEPRPKTD